MLGKKWMMTLVCFVLVVMIGVICFFAFRPVTSVIESVCAQIEKQYGDCKRIIFIDTKANLVFAESELGITPVLVDNGFTKIIKVVPLLYFQEFKEENQPISWQVTRKLQKNFSLVSGFASDDAKSIILTSEGGIQPNRFFIKDNLWFWYAPIDKEEIELPIEVIASDENGQVIYDGNEE